MTIGEMFKQIVGMDLREADAWTNRMAERAKGGQLTAPAAEDKTPATDDRNVNRTLEG